jgi:uracil-DNA glycosylase
MRWTEPQVAMLREMGIRLWSPRPMPTETAANTHAAELSAQRQKAVLKEVHRSTLPLNIKTPPAPSAPPDLLASSQVATLDWASLRQAVVNCTACRLCEKRRQPVFGVGHANAHWMIVGEAPGEQEDHQGEPFVGKSGQLLDNMLRAIALSRAKGSASQQVYIANTVKCRPPGNRNPSPQELAQCEPYLIRQVQLVQPKIILAMGRFAVQSLLRSTEPIGRLRGRMHDYQGVPLIVTYHPAYLLRNPEDKAKAWDDLRLALTTWQNLP